MFFLFLRNKLISCCERKNTVFFSRVYYSVDKIKRNLLLLDLAWDRGDTSISLGYASLLANLNQHDIDVQGKRWYVNSPSFSTDQVLNFILKNSTNQLTDVGIGVYIWNEKHVQKILHRLSDAGFAGRIILGGPQITYAGFGIEKLYPAANIFIRGYAENSLVNLFKDIKNQSEISGIYRVGGEDTDTLSSVDMKTIASPILDGVVEASSVVRWETKRGCSYACAFCQYKYPRAKQRQVDFFPMERIIEELEWIIVNQHLIERIAIVDACFNYGGYYLPLLRYLIEHKLVSQLDLECRVELITSEFLDLIQELNKTSHVVLQFGVQTIVSIEEKIINRFNNKERIIDVLKETGDRNITSEVSLIYGLPFQTFSSFKQSIEFCKTYGAPIIRAFPLMLLRGTELYNRKDELNLAVSSMTMAPFPYVISSPSFTYNDWLRMREVAKALEQYNKDTENKSIKRRNKKLGTTTIIKRKYNRFCTLLSLISVYGESGMLFFSKKKNVLSAKSENSEIIAEATTTTGEGISRNRGFEGIYWAP